MSRINRAIQRIKRNKRAPIIYFLNRGRLSRILSDETWIRMMWKAKFGSKLNLDNPTSFNEKLLWLSLNYRIPIYTKMVDKYAARQIVAQKIGQQYLVPLIGYWENASLIDFNELPEQFVLKCNHNSGGGMCVCKDKKTLNIEKTIKDINDILKKNYYWTSREWSYKNVHPLVIAEQFLQDSNTDNQGLIDYKFYCFNGEPKFFYIGFANIVNGIKHDQLSYMDLDWNKTPFYRKDHEPFPFEVTKPSNWDEMIGIARKLSEGIPFVRIDLYNISGKIFFSEFTLYPGGGYGKFYPDEWENTLGSWIELPSKNNIENVHD